MTAKRTSGRQDSNMRSCLFEERSVTQLSDRLLQLACVFITIGLSGAST
jgi:hypothetical protein